MKKKIDLLEKTDVLFVDEYYTNALNIPSEYIKGFKYYMVENDDFTTLLKSKNKNKIEFMIGQLAIKYIQIIATENE